MPTVSIVLPTYNRAYILPKAIGSILGQTFTDFELIIVDDGSVDNTKEVIDAFRDSRIKYVRHEKNKGISAARNTGVALTQGAFIAGQDSDDMWLPHYLERAMKSFATADSRVGVVYTRIQKKMRDGTTVLVPPLDFYPTSGDLYEKLLEGNFITMQAAVMRRECFDSAGGFEKNSEFDSIYEWSFWLSVSQTYEFVFIPEIGLEIAVLGDSVTSNQAKRLRARELIFLKHLKEFKRYPAIYARHAYSIGHAYAIRGEKLRARKYLWWSVKERYNTRALSAFLLAVLPIPNFYKYVTTLYSHSKLYRLFSTDHVK